MLNYMYLYASDLLEFFLFHEFTLLKLFLCNHNTLGSVEIERFGWCELGGLLFKFLDLIGCQEESVIVLEDCNVSVNYSLSSIVISDTNVNFRSETFS